MNRAAGARPPADRPYGSAVGEPPLLADPRRWGSLIGLVGGMTFIASYSSTLGPVVSAVSWVAGAVGVSTALYFQYIRPVGLGPLARPRLLALGTYCACVVAEVALIALGSRILIATGHNALRPALIATVVGLHFLPFAWAFGERMFLYLGCAVTVLGAAGLIAGAAGLPQAADAAAVAAGLTMLVIITIYARGSFAPDASPSNDRTSAAPTRADNR